MTSMDLATLDGVDGLTADLIVRLAWGDGTPPAGLQATVLWAYERLLASTFGGKHDGQEWLAAYRVGNLFAAYVDEPLRIITTLSLTPSSFRATEFLFVCRDRRIRMSLGRRAHHSSLHAREPRIEWAVGRLAWVPSRLTEIYSVPENNAIEATVFASHSGRLLADSSQRPPFVFRGVMRTLARRLEASLWLRHDWNPLYYFSPEPGDSSREVLTYEPVADRWTIGERQHRGAQQVEFRDPTPTRVLSDARVVGPSTKWRGEASSDLEAPPAPRPPSTLRQLAKLIISLARNEPREWKLQELADRTAASIDEVCEALDRLVHESLAETAKRPEGTWYKLDGGADVLVPTHP